MSSYALIGSVSHPKIFSIANKSQRATKLHVYDKDPMFTFSPKLSQAINYECVADMILNMDRPRTIILFDNSRTDFRRIVAWSDENDTIINCSNEIFKWGQNYERICEDSNINYMDGSLDGNIMMVGGLRLLFEHYEPFFYLMARSVVYTGDTISESKRSLRWPIA